jgi:predicted Zn-dependent peptidase
MGIENRTSLGTSLDSVEPVRAELSNGLRIVGLTMPSVHRTAISCELNVGSRYEKAEDNGLSHLLEHMLYRGIPGHDTAHEQALAFETLGGTLVATTSHEFGTLAVSCPPANFEPTLALFARVFQEPLLEGLSVERRIVKEEILERLDERGGLVDDHDLLRALAFPDHPLGRPVTGTVATVESFDTQRIRRHHVGHYVGAGTVIAVAGPGDAASIVREVERYFDGLPRGTPTTVEAPEPQTDTRCRYVRHASSQTALRVGFRGGGMTDADQPAVELLVRLLDDGNSTRLYTRICDERGLSYDVSAGYEALRDVGFCDVACGMAHEEAFTVLSEIFGVIRSLRDDGPEPAELDKAKARHRWSIEHMLDDPSELADFFADATLRDYAPTLQSLRDRIDSVSIDDVLQAARRLLRPENLSAVIVGLQSAKQRMALEKLVYEF